MNHQEVRNRMADYLDGGIALDQRALFDAHLDACEPCTREMGELRATIQLLRRLPEPELPPRLADDVLRKIRTGEIRVSLLDRVRDWLSEFSAPGVAVPATALVAAFAVAIASGQFQISGFETARLRATDIANMPAIPPEAHEMVQRIFVKTPDGIRAPSAFAGASERTPLPAGPAVIVSATPVSTRSRGYDRTSVIARPQGGSVLWGGPSASVGDRAPRSPDDWLEVLLQRPAEFARVQASQPLAAREHWVRALSSRAVERGISDRVVAVLQTANQPESLDLAQAFAAEAGMPSVQRTAPR